MCHQDADLPRIPVWHFSYSTNLTDNMATISTASNQCSVISSG